MNETENKRFNKRDYWQDQINKWQDSNLSQSDFCHQSGIKLSSFVYWRGLFLDSKNKNINQFVPIKIVKDEEKKAPMPSIQIKLLNGHVVYLPIEIGMSEIAKLLHLLGLPHA